MSERTITEVRTTGAEIETLLDPIGRSVLDYWNSLRPSHYLIPLKSSFSPVAIPKALPFLQVVEKRSEDGEFVYRLIGTRLVRERGFDPTGMLVRDGFYGTSVARVIEDYALTIDEKQPLFDAETIREPGQEPVVDSALFLPMTDDDAVCRYVLVYSDATYYLKEDNGGSF